MSQVPDSSKISAVAESDSASELASRTAGFEPLDTGESVDSTRPKSIARLLILVVVAFFVWRFIDKLGWNELAQRIGQAQKPLVALAFGALATRFGLIYYRWSLVLKLLALPMSRLIVWSSLMTGVLLNHITPTARVLGGIVRARGLSKIYQVSFSSIYATILVEQLGNQLVQTVLLWVAVVPFAWKLGWRRTALAIGVVPPVVLALWLAWRRLRAPTPCSPQWSTLVGRRLKTQVRRLGPIAAGGRRIAEIFRAAFGDIKLQWRLAACGVGIVISNALALWLVLQSLSTDIGFFYVFATVSLGLAAGMLTGTPGGFATTEAAMIALLVAVGVPEIDAAAGVLLYRGLHYAIVLVAGSICAVFFEITVARRSRPRGEPAVTPRRGNGPPDAGSR